VGHVENNHSVRLIIQSLGVGIIFTYLVGDIQGLTEIISGSGAGLLQSSFSREMEIEADNFSVVSLDKINIPKERFIFAMETIGLNEDESGSNSLLVKYLSTHPHTEERIQLVKDL
jgi:Zn-dependent protease with chaperone function